MTKKKIIGGIIIILAALFVLFRFLNREETVSTYESRPTVSAEQPARETLYFIRN